MTVVVVVFLLLLSTAAIALCALEVKERGQIVVIALLGTSALWAAFMAGAMAIVLPEIIPQLFSSASADTHPKDRA